MDQRKPKTGGRRKGTPNKVTATARENIIAVFNRLGGTAAMAEWARENQTEFYKLYARLIPGQAQLDVFSLERVIEDSWDKPFKPLPPSLAHLETIVRECAVEKPGQPPD